MDGWVNGWMNEFVGGWMDRLIQIGVHACMDAIMAGLVLNWRGPGLGGKGGGGGYSRWVYIQYNFIKALLFAETC